MYSSLPLLLTSAVCSGLSWRSVPQPLASPSRSPIFSPTKKTCNSHSAAKGPLVPAQPSCHYPLPGKLLPACLPLPAQTLSLQLWPPALLASAIGVQMKHLFSLKRSSSWPVYPTLPARWMQPLRNILLAGAAEGEGTGTARRHDHTCTHRQCHDHRAASETVVAPSTTPSTSVHPPSLPTPRPCGSRQIPHSSSCCLGSKSTWGVGTRGTQGLAEAPGPPRSSLPSPEICPCLQRCAFPLHANHSQRLGDS